MLIAWRLYRRRIATARWPIPQGTGEPSLPKSVSTLRRAQLESEAADHAEAQGENWVDDHEGIDEFGAPTSSDSSSFLVPPAAGTYAAKHAQRGQPPGRAIGRRLPPPASPLPTGTITFGIRGNTEIPLTPLGSHGLGLTGQGALAAGRALLIGLLAAGSRGPERDRPHVVIPQADAQQLIAGHASPGTETAPAAGPPNMIITESISTALDHIEAEVTRRLRVRESAGTAPESGGRRSAVTVALIARPSPAVHERLQSVLQAGANAGVIGILLGAWEPGVTCSIRDDGIVTAATGADLTGVQAFHLPKDETADLLAFLRNSYGHVADERPGSGVPLYPLTSSQHATAPLPDIPADRSSRPDGELGGEKTHHSETDEEVQPDVKKPQPRSSEPEPAPHKAGGDHTHAGIGPHSPPAHLPASVACTVAAVTDRQRSVQVHLLGQLRIEASGHEVVSGLRRSSRELLAFLALFSEGATGERVMAALWPDHTPTSARIALQTALRSLRVTLREATGAPGPMFVTYGAGRYHIDHNLFDVDLWRFRHALSDAHQAVRSRDPAAERESLSRSVESYRGALAEDAPYEWIESYREEIRRQAVDAFTRLAGMYEPAESEQALALLDRALTHDAINEQLHQRIMTIQARLGRPDAVHRTLTLLENRLTDLGLTPSEDTYALAADLQHQSLANSRNCRIPTIMSISG